MVSKGTRYGEEMKHTYRGDCDNSFTFKCLSYKDSNGTCQERYNLNNGVIVDKNNKIVGNVSCCNQSFEWVKQPSIS